MFRIVLSNRAIKGLDRLDSDMKNRVEQLIESLKTDSIPSKQFDVIKISGSVSNYRVRMAWCRVLYTVLHGEQLIKVHDIDRRKNRTYH